MAPPTKRKLAGRANREKHLERKKIQRTESLEDELEECEANGSQVPGHNAASGRQSGSDSDTESEIEVSDSEDENDLVFNR